MRNQDIKPTLPLGFYFMLVGPIVGLALVLIMIFFAVVVAEWSSLFAGIKSYFQMFPFFFVYGSVTACIVGPLPALITGMVAKHGKTNTEQIVYAMASGAVTCIVASLIINIDLLFASASLVFGAVSGLCVMVLRQRSINKLNLKHAV